MPGLNWITRTRENAAVWRVFPRFHAVAIDTPYYINHTFVINAVKNAVYFRIRIFQLTPAIRASCASSTWKRRKAELCQVELFTQARLEFDCVAPTKLVLKLVFHHYVISNQRSCRCR